MIDPFTAFAMAQAAVAGIKKAVALGKDINGLITDFSKFYHSADLVHESAIKTKIQAVRLSDADINAQALQIAMASNALREHEKELKDLLFWSGHAAVWQEMMAERQRMKKLRQEEDQRIKQQKQKDREMKYNALMATLWMMASLSIVIPAVTILFQLITVKHL